MLRHRPDVPLRDESDELALIPWGIETGRDFAEVDRSMSATSPTACEPTIRRRPASPRRRSAAYP